MDVIGIPVSILRSGDRSVRGPYQPRSDPPVSDIDPSRPIPPAEQPARLAALEAAVRERTGLVPRLGIVLGSGLGGLADALDDPVAIPFAELPGWPAATAPGHVGRLLLGALEGVPVVDAPGPLPHVRGQRPGPRRPAGPPDGPARSERRSS